MDSPCATRPYPPRRLPSRNSRRSLSVTPPKVPTHRARRSFTESFASPIFAQSSSANTPFVFKERGGASAGFGAQRDFNGLHRESPHQQQSAADAVLQSRERRQDPSHSYSRALNDELSRQYNPRATNKDNHAQLVGYCVCSRKACSMTGGDCTNAIEEQRNDYRNRTVNTRQSLFTDRNPDESNREDAYRDQVYVGNAQRTTVTGVIDVTPCRWRLEKDPNAELVEIQIRNIDTATYKVQKIFQMIERSLPFCANDSSTSHPSSSLTPYKGSLFIYRKDNAHLVFHSCVPNAVSLKRTMVLDDIIDTTRLPPEGTKVSLRWIEDTPEAIVKNYLNDDCRTSATLRASTRANREEDIQFPEQDGCVHSPSKIHRDGSQQLSKVSGRPSNSFTFEPGNVHYIPQSPARHSAEWNREFSNSFANQKVSYNGYMGSPITYLQSPRILYKRRLESF